MTWLKGLGISSATGSASVRSKPPENAETAAPDKLATHPRELGLLQQAQASFAPRPRAAPLLASDMVQRGAR